MTRMLMLKEAGKALGRHGMIKRKINAQMALFKLFRGPSSPLTPAETRSDG